MSYTYLYNPKVVNPRLPNDIVQLRSAGDQPSFFFGGAQQPYNFGLSSSQYQGAHPIIGAGMEVEYGKYKRILHKKNSPIKFGIRGSGLGP